MQCLLDRACPFSCGVQLSVIALSILLAGCADRLVMVERTGFNLSVAVYKDPATPLSVNAGLERRIVGVVPARKVQESKAGNNSIAVEEPVSLLSGFDLQYTNPPATTTVGTPAQTRFGGDLTIRTRFASGKAALLLAKNPTAVNQLISVNGSIAPPIDNQGSRTPSVGSSTPSVARDWTNSDVLPEPEPLPNGVPDAVTPDEKRLEPEDMVQIQSALCINRSGEFDDPTRQAINDFYPLARGFHHPAPQPPSQGPRFLSGSAIFALKKEGSCDPQFRSYYERRNLDERIIHFLQEKLGVLGNGRMENETRAAIRKKQELEGQIPTGIVDEQFMEIML